MTSIFKKHVVSCLSALAALNFGTECFGAELSDTTTQNYKAWQSICRDTLRGAADKVSVHQDLFAASYLEEGVKIGGKGPFGPSWLCSSQVQIQVHGSVQRIKEVKEESEVKRVVMRDICVNMAGGIFLPARQTVIANDIEKGIEISGKWQCDSRPPREEGEEMKERELN